MTDDEKAAVVDVLCGLALSDHLGDVRDAEEGLWKLLGADQLPSDHPARDSDSPWRITRARLQAANIPLPAYLTSPDDDDDA